MLISATGKRFREDLPDALVRLRKARDWTQGELAERVWAADEGSAPAASGPSSVHAATHPAAGRRLEPSGATSTALVGDVFRKFTSRTAEGRRSPASFSSRTALRIAAKALLSSVGRSKSPRKHF